MEQNVLEKLKKWAQDNDNVEALVLTSSRVEGSTAKVDQFSDYDVCVYVKSLTSFETDEWLNAFGETLVKWPKVPQPTFDKNWITRLVIFEDRTRIDFQITNNLHIAPSDYDLGYQVLVDKTGISQQFPTATKSKRFIQKPSQDEFLNLVNDFFWDATYVAKYLWRGDLFYAKFMFDSALRFEYFEKVIEWHIGSKNDWQVGTNIHGKYFPKYLDKEAWSEIEETFAGASTEENWTAFFKMVELFTRFAKQVAGQLSYNYPEKQEEKMISYFKQSKDL